MLLGLLEYVRGRGHEAIVIAPAESALHEACRERGVPTRIAEFGLSPASALRLRSLLRELRPDVVHGMSIFPVAYVRRLGLLPDRGTVPSFAEVTVDPASVLPVATKRFRGLMLRFRNAVSRTEAPRLRAIFVPSPLVELHLGELGIHGRVLTLTGMVDPERLARESEYPLELPEGRPRIGYAGFIEKLKGIDLLVRAFSEIALAYPEAVLLVAGDGPEREPLEALAQSLGIGDRVTFLGFIEPSVAPLISALDIFVSPSHTEAQSSSIVEAMALGVPCVATAAGGTPELVTDGENGVLVEPGSPHAIAQGVLRLLADPALAARIAENGHATALSPKHLLSARLDTILSEYEAAVSRAGAAV